MKKDGLIVVGILVGVVGGIVLWMSLKSSPKPKKEETAAEIAFRQHYVDSVTEALTANAINKAYYDTANLAEAPIKITDARVIDSEGGNYRNVRLKWINTSKKKISAVRFRWYAVDAFGDPADFTGSYARGFGGGFSDDPIGPGKSDSGVWSVLSRNARKIVKAWPTEVAFDDGTKWKSEREE